MALDCVLAHAHSHALIFTRQVSPPVCYMVPSLKKTKKTEIVIELEGNGRIPLFLI